MNTIDTKFNTQDKNFQLSNEDIEIARQSLRQYKANPKTALPFRDFLKSRILKITK